MSLCPRIQGFRVLVYADTGTRDLVSVSVVFTDTNPLCLSVIKGMNPCNEDRLLLNCFIFMFS